MKRAVVLFLFAGHVVLRLVGDGDGRFSPQREIGHFVVGLRVVGSRRRLVGARIFRVFFGGHGF